MSDRVDSLMKDLLRSMQLVQMNVPCTDGCRAKIRYQMRSLQIWPVMPLIFFTLNPADVKHPFTLLYSVEGVGLRRVGFPLGDADLLARLKSH